jgi:hypothetical protein
MKGLKIEFKKGLEKGLEKGLKKGSLIAYRRNLLDVLMLRFEPSLPVYHEIEEGL